MHTALLLLLAASMLCVHALPKPAGAGSKALDTSQVFIQGITYGGSGCPQGTAAVTLNDEKTTFTIAFDQFVASVGPGVPITDSRKSCQLNAKVHVPQGFQFSIFTADYRGAVNLDAGVTASIGSLYYFAGRLDQTSIQSPFKGPINQDYTFRDAVPLASVVWSACGETDNLNINTRIQVNQNGKHNAEGFLENDSIDGKLTQVLTIQWQRCTK
ncbi:hypothetical protein RI367_002358 [Sorochytrium milnesiophthora]